MIFRSLGLLAVFLYLLPCCSWAQVPERRNGHAPDKLGWFIAPTPTKLEGLGTAFPVFGLISNFYQSTDLIAVKTLPGGDFDISVFLVDQLPVFTKHVQYTGGQFNEVVSVNLFDRGIDSNKDKYIRPLIRISGAFQQVKFLFWEERLELFVQQFSSDSEVKKILDPHGVVLSQTSSKSHAEASVLGLVLDFTDDRIDPREGVRLGQMRSPHISTDLNRSDQTVIDTDLSVYLPLFSSDTLVFNLFRSSAQINRLGVTDPAQVRALNKQYCTAGTAVYAACKASEDQLVADYIAGNQHGNATKLGGANRLRAYQNGRFGAGNTGFQALEYRMNFSSVPKAVNWYVMGGVRTVLQLAFFAERGTVNDDRHKLDSNMKSSYGVGLRSLISGFIYRLDVANGDEGVGVTLFISYPLELNSLSGGG